MNLLVIIDSNGQDLTLGGVIDGTMKSRGWLADDRFSFAYSKTLAQSSETEAVKLLKADVDATTLEGEWKNVKYLYVIDGKDFNFEVSPGD